MSTRGRALIAGIVAFACLGIDAAPSAHASQPSSTGCVADAELKVGDSGSSVICLQYALGMLGLSQMPISGVYDDATANLVTWFQATHPPLRVDGRAGPQTLTAMGIYSGQTTGVELVNAVVCSADATIRPGETSQSVRCLQDSLRELGLFDGASNGTADVATVGALQRFQALTPPLDVDGWAGPRTLAALGIWSGRTGIVSSDGTVSFPIIGTPSSSGGRGGSGVVGNPPAGPWPASVQPEKNWSLTADGIPNYGNRVPCTRVEADTIAYQFARDGADVATQQWAVYIASREGGCHFDAVNQNLATQDDSHCTFQLNVLSGAFGPTGELGRHGWTAENVKASLDNCADAASDLWVYCGRGPWQPPYSCRPPWKDISTAAKVPATPINPTTIVPVTAPLVTTAPATTDAPPTSTTLPPDALTSVTVTVANPNPEG
ncbi:MAG: peptidoglycan-binding domain-containing protein [Ilumatobacteraceae bacterium]